MRETPADAVFILGDLFEVWVGDDAAAAPGLRGRLRRGAAGRGRRARRCSSCTATAISWSATGFLQACGTTLLPDPTVLGFGGRRWLLTHGDALCLATPTTCSSASRCARPPGSSEFLAKPLAQRQAIASDLREQSEARKRSGIDIRRTWTATQPAPGWRRPTRRC